MKWGAGLDQDKKTKGDLMPYESNEQLPPPVKEALGSSAELSRFRGAFNACMYDGGTEQKCFRIGYAAARKAKSTDLPVGRALVVAKRALKPWAWGVLNRSAFSIGGRVYTLKEVLKAYSRATIDQIAGRPHDIGPDREAFRRVIDIVNNRTLAKSAIDSVRLPGWVRACLFSAYTAPRLPVVFIAKGIDDNAARVLSEVYAPVLGCEYTTSEDATTVDATGAVLVALGNGDHVNQCDFKLPHPLALLAKGDRGEVVRKSRAIRKALDTTPGSVVPLTEATRIDSEPSPDSELNSLSVKITKSDKTLQVVTGIVLEPFGGYEREPDTQGDFVNAKEIESAAHKYLAKSRIVGLEHSEKAEGATVVESYLVPYPTVKDYRDAMDGKDHSSYRLKLGDGEVVSGTWVVSTKLPGGLWKDYLAGKVNAYSMGGLGARVKHSGGLPAITYRGVLGGE